MYSALIPVSYTHLRAHETRHDLVCRLLLEKKKKKKKEQKKKIKQNKQKKIKKIKKIQKFYFINKLIYNFFFFQYAATTKIYTLHIVGSVRCVQETEVILLYVILILIYLIDFNFLYFFSFFFSISLIYFFSFTRQKKYLAKKLLKNQFHYIKSYKSQSIYTSNYVFQLQNLVVEVYPSSSASFSLVYFLSLIHISEPTRLGMISYAVFCLKKKKKKKKNKKKKQNKINKKKQKKQKKFKNFISQINQFIIFFFFFQQINNQQIIGR
eukprot:TRINITY_DN11496_c0_g1_i2.p1 TRINITY_DN11496_c0_g1~~TRINITY_DN11496_c0_g1_i2.p1  ORF type:complete len:267 (-),score=86.20 TRINITY_DN11496_c0_g1_i2:461-1261(-)